jgi:photosystem II stability/assembly factor-like uncharacterized protein
MFFETIFILNAQWQLVNGPGKASVYAIGYDANNWYAILGSGLFRSTNEGNDWKYFNNMGTLDYQTESCIYNSGDTIFIGSKNGLYYSIDAGQSWELITEGLIINQYFSSRDIITIALHNKIIYMLTREKLYTFDLGKKNFSPIEIGNLIDYRNMLISEKYLLVGSNSHTYKPLRFPNIFISKDRGITWNSITDSISKIDEVDINCFIKNNDTIYAGTSNGIYASYDEGNHWKLLENGLIGNEIKNIIIAQDGVYVGTKNGVFYASEMGNFWEKKVNGLTNQEIISMTNINEKILVGTHHGLFYTTDKGDNWVSINRGLGGGSIPYIKENFGKLYVYAYEEGIFSSIDSGITWQLIVDGSMLIQWGVVAIDNNNIYNASNRTWQMLYSLDNGKSWKIVPNSATISGRKIHNLSIEEHNVIACTDKGIFISEDSAKSWYSLSPAIEPYQFHFVYFDNNDIFAGSLGQGLFKSTDKGKEWIHNSTVFGAYNILTDIVKTGKDIFVASYSGGVFKSTDNGMTWDSVNNGLGNKFIISLAEYKNNIFASSQNGIFLTTNNGDEWEEVSEGLTTKWIYKLLIVGDNIFACSPEGLFKAKISDFGITEVEKPKIENINYLYCYPPYPVPATNFVRSLIYWDTSLDIENDDIAVYDIFGNKVAGKEKITIDKQNAYSGILSWNCTNVPDGIYLIRLIHGTETRTMKVIVSK